MAHDEWSTWMKWKREESKKQKVNAKVDMYLVSFCLLGYSIEGYLSPSSFSLESSWECIHQSCPFTWPRITFTLGLGFASSSFSCVLSLLKDPYELLFKGCSLSCKRVYHFVINFVFSTTIFHELSFLEVN